MQRDISLLQQNPVSIFILAYKNNQIKFYSHISSQFPNHTHMYLNLILALVFSELHFNQCYPEARPNPERLTLTLPDDLTPHTKQVLNEIYAKFDRSFDEFYENAKLKLKQSFEDSFRKIDCYMNSFREKQKAEIRTFIENVLEDSSFVPPPDTFFGDLSYVPPRQPHQPPPPAGNASAPMINMEAVRQTLECPGVDPRLRQQFFAQLNDLNDVLSEIVDQADRRCPLPQREAPARPPPIPEVPQAESEDTQFQPLTCTR